MTDLATRIADVKKKAEAAAQVRVLSGWQAHIRDYRRAASPDLILAMAAEIDRLTAQLDKAREALEPFAKDWAENWTGLHDDTGNDDLHFDDSGDSDILIGHIRAAARVHAETK